MASARKTPGPLPAEGPQLRSGTGPKARPAQAELAAAGQGPQAAIEKAKLDWESTADALAALVCLLSRKGKVMRTNRVVEDWSLGTVSSVLGKSAHGLLHPGCRVPRCPLTGSFSNAMEEIRRGTLEQS